MSLNPFELLLDSIDKKILTLESKSRIVKPTITSFRNDALGFNPASISPRETVNEALAKYTPEAIGAGTDDIAYVNQFVDDCLSDAIAGIKRYLYKVIDNVEDGIDLISDILALPENLLMKQLQRIRGLVDDIQGLVRSVDGKITCVTSADEAGTYTAEVTAAQARVDQVIDDLYLSDEGAFDSSILLNGVDSDLINNLQDFETRAKQLESDINDNVDTAVNVPSTVNPASRF